MARVPAAVSALLMGLFLAACGASSPGIPRTAANVSACRAFRATLRGSTTGKSQLVGQVLQSNAPITHKLRQDLGNYITLSASGGGSMSQQAESQAKQDCAAIGIG